MGLPPRGHSLSSLEASTCRRTVPAQDVPREVFSTGQVRGPEVTSIPLQVGRDGAVCRPVSVCVFPVCQPLALRGSRVKIDPATSQGPIQKLGGRRYKMMGKDVLVQPARRDVRAVRDVNVVDMALQSLQLGLGRRGKIAPRI